MFMRTFRISHLTQSKCYIAAAGAHHPYRCRRLKSDIVAPNNAIDNMYMHNGTITAIDRARQREHRPASDAAMPFEAIPCADPTSVSRLQRFTTALTFVRRMVSGNWEHRFHEDIDRLHTRLGPIFRQTHCSHPVVFVKSPQLLRDVFTFEGKYPKHPLPEAWTYYNRLHRCERGLFFMDDAEWLETRKQLAPLMLRNEERFAAAIECATDHLLEQWQRNGDGGGGGLTTADGFVELPQVLTSLYGWSIRVLLATMFGVDVSRNMYAKLGGQIDAFAEVVQHIFDDTVPLSHISPQTARTLRLNVWRKFEQSVTDTLAIAGSIIEYGCQQPHGDHSLLGAMKALGMSSAMIQRVFVDFVIAAGDTTAFTTQWAMYALAKHPHVQRTVRQELESGAAAGRLDGPLIRGTVRETLRLYPVATFIGRILAKDAVLGNYRVGKHTLVYISMYSAGRDEHSFPQANSFVPSRWSRDPATGTLDQVSHAQSFVPFALGARNCIGQRIANAQMHAILAKLLRTFELKLLNESEIDVVMRLIIAPSRPIRFAVRKI